MKCSAVRKDFRCLTNKVNQISKALIESLTLTFGDTAWKAGLVYDALLKSMCLFGILPGR